MQQEKDKYRERLSVLLELLAHSPMYQREGFRVELRHALEQAVLKAFLVK